MGRASERYRPQLAMLVKTPPEGDEWLHEIKYDGYRIGCLIDGASIRLVSRNGRDWTRAFPEIVEEARALSVDGAILDGEVAILLPDGRTSFQALQNALGRNGRSDLVYFAFDLLYREGVDVSRLPLEERKSALAELLRRSPGTRRIRYSEHFVGRGREVFRNACGLGLEGIVSKRRDQPYRPGRGPMWRKTKCVSRQEFVIGGFTDPGAGSKALGALLVGYYEEGRLVFGGKVGTGFTSQSAIDLRRRLERLRRGASPFQPPPPGWLGRHAHWVEPELVAEVAFTEWTADRRIRHPSFQGLRADRDPRQIVREEAADLPKAIGAPAVVRVQRGARKPDVEVAGVRLSTPDRVLVPDIALTKLELARFYERIADWILPHLEGRPLTLVHCPKGIGEECFYMKHSKVWAPEPLRRVRIREKTKLGEYLIVDTRPGLVGLVQMNILEIHTWNTRFDRVEIPDRIVLDVDPGPAVDWAVVIEAAQLIRSALDALGLRSFVKTTGGKGLHVVVPLERRGPWTECLAFSRALAEALERQDPGRYTTSFKKQGREGKILIDYLRNNRTNTSVAAFSTRAKPGAPLSTPIAWSELTPRVRPDAYNVKNVEARLAGLTKDPWADYWTTRQRITRAMSKALENL